MNLERRIAAELVSLGLDVELCVKVIIRLMANPLALAYIQRGKLADALHVAGVEIPEEDYAYRA